LDSFARQVLSFRLFCYNSLKSLLDHQSCSCCWP
jgi:hypothetical protein